MYRPKSELRSMGLSCFLETVSPRGEVHLRDTGPNNQFPELAKLNSRVEQSREIGRASDQR
jgi:hypothetical protein